MEIWHHLILISGSCIQSQWKIVSWQTLWDQQIMLSKEQIWYRIMMKLEIYTSRTHQRGTLVIKFVHTFIIALDKTQSPDARDAQKVILWCDIINHYYRLLHFYITVFKCQWKTSKWRWCGVSVRGRSIISYWSQAAVSDQFVWYRGRLSYRCPKKQ